MLFRLLRVRYHFEAADSVHFPEGKSANILRGAFGTIFRRIACLPECAEAGSCAIRDQCPYARAFEPRPSDAHPSGLADLPRPFVFRASHLDGRTIHPGGTFYFDLHLFDLANPLNDYFEQAFRCLAQDGLGPRRGRAVLVRAESPKLIEADLATRPEGVSRVMVRFLTPTELKVDGGLAARPEFGILYARLRDRISTLRATYGAGPLDIDFRAAAERASKIRMVRCDLRHHDVTRRSSRTGQTHPIGGFTGEAVYEGTLPEWMPYLQLARYVGVGRQTVWGKGELAVQASFAPGVIGSIATP